MTIGQLVQLPERLRAGHPDIGADIGRVIDVGAGLVAKVRWPCAEPWFKFEDLESAE